MSYDCGHICCLCRDSKAHNHRGVSPEACNRCDEMRNLPRRLRESAGGPGERATVAILEHTNWLADPTFGKGHVAAAGEHRWVLWPEVRQTVPMISSTDLERETLLLAYDVACSEDTTRFRNPVFNGLDDDTLHKIADALNLLAERSRQHSIG